MPLDTQPAHLAPRAYEEDIDLVRYGRFLATYWFVLVLCGVAGALGGAALVRLLPAYYRATATLAMSPAGAATAVPLTPATAKALLTNTTLAAETIKESGLAADGWTPQRFVDDAVDAQAAPPTNLIKLHVVLRDPDKARVAATLLAGKAIELSHRVDRDSVATTRQALTAQAAAAERAVKEAEEGLLAYQLTADMERLEFQIRAAYEREQRQPLTPAASAALAGQRADLYRRRFELHRRQADYDARLRAFNDISARVLQARTWPADPSQLRMVAAPVLPDAPLPSPMPQFAVVGALLGLAAGVVIALLLNRRRLMSPLR